MRYSEAVRLAPPGAARFQPEDLLRLDRWALCLLLSDGPAALPPADLRAALSEAGFRDLLGRLPEGFARAATAVRPAPDGEAARLRVVAGAFWLLVYGLEPELWDALSRAETLPPGLVEALPRAERVLEVAAGSGRLTTALARQARTLIAVEPSRPLRALLRRRAPGALVVSAVAQALPVTDGWADLTVSCASFGPDAPLGGPGILAEMERCTRRGGRVALVGPESPAWFEARGFRAQRFEPTQMSTPPELAGFFGPRLQPPADLLLKVIR